MTKKTEIKSGDDNKKNTRGNQRDKNPVTSTVTKEKIQQTTMKRRNDGETKTTTSDVRGEQKTSSTTKISTKTTSEKPDG